jgi:cell division protein FtsZ
MKEEVRVTVIATGFEKGEVVQERHENIIRPDFAAVRRVADGRGAPRPGPPAAPEATPIHRPAPGRPIDRKLPSDLEIPTFIRRQMD